MFVKKIIGPDEKVIGMTTIHWIYALRGVFWMAVFMIAGRLIDTHVFGYLLRFFVEGRYDAVALIGNYFFWACTIIGVTLFLSYFILMIATEVALTDKRIILKKGLLFVDVKEVDLEEIKAAQVDNGLLGRFLNYGYVKLDARFVNNMLLPALGDPYRFVKALNEARSNLRADSMKIVLEGSGEDAKEEILESHENKEAPHQLKDPRYKATEENTAQASKAVVQETRENIKTVLAPEKPHTVSGVKNGAGPILFQKETLRDIIKNDFSDTAAS